MGGPLDPRTVSPEVLLRRLGHRRPDVSVIILPGAAFPTEADEAGAPSLMLPGLRVQIVNHDVSMQEAATAMLCNVLAQRALAPILVVLPSSPWTFTELREAVMRLRGDTMCGSVPLGTSGDGLATRTEAWRAFLGLDPEIPFVTAVRDYQQRLLSIGYQAQERRGTLRPAVESTPSLVIYTAITAGYDTLKPLPAHLLDGCTAIAFVDRTSRPTTASQYRGWTLVETAFPGEDLARQSRYPKINAHLALPDAEFSLWIDASISIRCPYPLLDMARRFLDNADICVFRHHARRSVAEEAAACKAYGLDLGPVIDAQLQRYAAAGFPDTWGLAEVPVLLRRHSPRMAAFNESWWEELKRGSRRDQISFPYVAWRQDLDCSWFPFTLQDRNGLFVKYQRGA